MTAFPDHEYATWDGLHPGARDLTAFDLPVEGAIRAGLNGCYLRNGPNPREAIGHT